MRGTGTTWGADAYGDYRFRNSVGDLSIQYGDTGVTSTRLTITSAGNVGIGTITNLAILTSANTGALTLDSNDGNFTGFGLYVQTPSTINTISSAIGFGVAQRKLAAIAMQSYADADQAGLNFYVQPTASGSAAVLTEAMRITSDGNVGIGTITPSYPLDVVGIGRFLNSSTKNSIFVSGAAASGGGGGVAFQRASTNIGWVAPSSYLENSANSTDLGMQANTGGALKFYTNNSVTPSMTIASTGNVLINTTTDAGYKLDVNGEGRFTGTLAGVNASSTLYAPLSEAARFPTASQIYLNNTNAAANSFSGISFQVTRPSGTNTNAYIGAISTTANPEIVFGQRDGGNNLYAERMRITSAGDVGIGTTSVTQPSAGATTLKILGTVTTKAGAIVMESSDASVSTYIYPDNTNGLSINTSTSHPITFRTAGTTRLTLASTGAATFSSNIDAGNKITSSGSNVSASAINGLRLYDTRGISTSRYWGISSGYGADGILAFRVGNANGDDPLSASGTQVLQIASTGAATFSSSVTATGGTASYSTSALPTATISTTTTGAINAAYTSIRIGARGQSGQDQSIAITNVPTADGNSAIAFTTMDSYSYAERMRITSGGNVLIGTTTDNASKLQVAGNLSLTTAGNKILIQTGTNASVGLSTLVGGTVTVSTTAVTSNSGIMLTCRTVGGTQGLLRISAITGGTSFVITSSSALDTSQIAWLIIN